MTDLERMRTERDELKANCCELVRVVQKAEAERDTLKSVAVEMMETLVNVRDDITDTIDETNRIVTLYTDAPAETKGTK